jgi:hypothetical protein
VKNNVAIAKAGALRSFLVSGLLRLAGPVGLFLTFPPGQAAALTLMFWAVLSSLWASNTLHTATAVDAARERWRYHLTTIEYIHRISGASSSATALTEDRWWQDAKGAAELDIVDHDQYLEREARLSWLGRPHPVLGALFDVGLLVAALLVLLLFSRGY